MGNEVSINKSEFNSNISSLQSKISDLNSDISITEEFEKTNIKPFTKDLKKALEAKNLLSSYQELLKKDSEILDETGQAMIENDERLANIASPQEVK